MYVAMNQYREQTYRLIRTLKANNCNTNAILDFFVQLSCIRPIMSIGIINAVKSELTDSSNLIYNSITRRPWMNLISLDDLRNHVVFVLWDNFQTVVDSTVYYDKTIEHTKYHSAMRDTLLVQDLAPLLETCLYIRHVCVIKEWVDDGFDDLSMLEQDEWDIYPNWLLHCTNKGGLSYTIYEVFKLIEKWL